jgi:hypothetical protein
MGQAKNRGSLQDRAEQAKARMDEIRPKKIICNNCTSEIHDIQDMDVRGLVGIRGVFSAICPTCKTATYAFDGEPDSVTELMLAMESTMSGPGKLGIQTKDGVAVDQKYSFNALSDQD